MTKATATGARSKTSPAGALFLRYAGSDKPATEVAVAARQRGDLPVTFPAGPAMNVAAAPQGFDYTLVDPALAVTPEPVPTSVLPPTPGLSYPGFSPHQRAAFHAWMEHPALPAPPAFQQLLLANAEVRLLEGGAKADAAYAALRLLAAAPAWHAHEGLARTLLLAFWLRQDGPALAQWSAAYQLPAALWSVALGCQSLLGEALQPDQLQGMAGAWGMPVPAVSAAVLRLRLDSLQTALGQEPLAHVLAVLDESAKTPAPWRCQHRELHLAFPQPNVRPLLQPLLTDLLAVIDVAEGSAGLLPTDAEDSTDEMPAAIAPPSKAGAKTSAKSSGKSSAKSKPEQSAPASVFEKAHIIVEFGASRSDIFAYVLRQAQKQSGFQQIMDENRHIVYRVPFRRSEMRRFWHLWEYVQGWATTRVYCDGRQLDKWQIYPYSQYLR